MTKDIKIPLVDLSLAHREIQHDILSAISRVVESQQFIMGPELDSFESAMAGYLGVSHAIGVSSGTDALLVALMAQGIGPGDEVITTPFTFISTAEVIYRLGAQPVFADIKPDDLLLDPEKIESAITPSTRAIIPVHLFGKPCPMDAIFKLAIPREIKIIEDCAQSLGASIDGQLTGSTATAGAFSFFPTKVLGGFGDGGLLSVNDHELATVIKQIRNHGSQQRDSYQIHGGNFRLDAIQAAVLNVKFKYLDKWLQLRKAAAGKYLELFADLEQVKNGDIVLPQSEDGVVHAYNLFVIQVPDRDRLKSYLQEQGIGTAVYYPTPLHLQPCYRELGYKKGDFPVAELASQKVLALPFYPGITGKQQESVAETIAGFYQKQ